jgi:hypothetical protein
MTDYKEDAETLRCGLLAGYTSVPDVVAWADTVIARESSPDPAFIEIALSGNRRPVDVVSLLREVPGDANFIAVRRRLLARMLEMLEADPNQGDAIATWLYRLALDGELPEADFGLQPFTLDDSFELVRMGSAAKEEALAELHEYLAKHAQTAAP